MDQGTGDDGKRAALSHRMVPGSHERPGGAACGCGHPWSRWNDTCTAPSAEISGEADPERVVTAPETPARDPWRDVPDWLAPNTCSCALGRFRHRHGQPLQTAALRRIAQRGSRARARDVTGAAA